MTETHVTLAFSSHIGTREYQQDYTQVGHGHDGVAFGILCDGMGGLADGELASSTAAEALAQILRDIPSFIIVPICAY